MVKIAPRPPHSPEASDTTPKPSLPRGPRLAIQVMAALVCLTFGVVALLSGRRPPATVGSDGLPERLPISLDGSMMRWIGKTADGSQFMVSTAFIDSGSGRRYFTTFYLFDGDGALTRSVINEIPEGTDKVTGMAALEKVKALREQHLKDIGPVKYGDIAVRPFQVLHQGTAFGLITEQKNGRPQVVLQPGPVITFRPPWNGSY
jgi:hypothetical protein